MKRSRFSEGQIIGILREEKADVATADKCRRHGISSATFYKWSRSSAVSTCQTVGVDRSSMHYRSRRAGDAAERLRIREIAAHGVASATVDFICC